MGWSNENEENSKKGMDSTSKLLLKIMIGVVLVIVIIIGILLSMELTKHILTLDGNIIENYDINKLVSKIDNKTYINIEEFSKLVKYEFHNGEYKAYTIEENKCYVQGKEETTSFFLDEDKIYKLPIDKLDTEYREISVEGKVEQLNGAMYATIDAINKAFNVVVEESEKSLGIYTLDYLVKTCNQNMKKWGYTNITNQTLENKKSILYGYLIVKKEGGLYKVINTNNTKEIVLDKYTSIEFSEHLKEFFVTNSLDQVGIINLDGTTKVEPIYESISLLDNKLDLYLVQKDGKYGIIKSGNVEVISPEYDNIGFKNENIVNTSKNKSLILDTLIPICKEGKWGAVDKNGNRVFDLVYDSFGSDITSVEINGEKKVVEPLLVIEKCNGIIVKQDNKYGLIDITGKELVPIAVECIYKIENKNDEDKQYFMLYNGQELNIIDRLVKAGLIESTIVNEKKEENDPQVNNNTQNTENTVTVSTNTTNTINELTNLTNSLIVNK